MNTKSTPLSLTSCINNNVPSLFAFFSPRTVKTLFTKTANNEGHLYTKKVNLACLQILSKYANLDEYHFKANKQVLKVCKMIDLIDKLFSIKARVPVKCQPMQINCP